VTRTVFAGGGVFDGESSGAGEVAIEGDRIVAVGTDLEGDRLIDTTDCTVLPGFFDCHVHVTASGDLDQVRALSRPFSLRYFEAVRNLAETVRTGVTSVRDAGGADLGVKTAVEEGLVLGPRMQIAITMLSQTGGHGDSTLPSGGCLRPFEGFPGNPSGIVDGPEEMRRRVRTLVREGADVLKVATSGGVLSARDDPRHAHFRDDELHVLVAEASAAGRFVMAHAQATDGIKAAIRAGIRSIEHGIYLDDEAIEMMRRQGTWLVPTLSAPRAVLRAAAEGARLAPAVLHKAEEVAAAHGESVRRAVAAGVRVAMGTDSGVGPHGRNLEEVGLMAEVGRMTPLEAWRATTAEAARLCGVDAERGRLLPGLLADLVVLRGAPEDLRGLRERVREVWMGGRRVVGPEALAGGLGPQPG